MKDLQILSSLSKKERLDKFKLFRYTKPMKCTLCQSENLTDFYCDSKRGWDYYVCLFCDFVFRDPKTYLAWGVEKQRYMTHNNSIENQGYVRFLSPVVEILSPKLEPGSVGLDFGSGPGPILDILFKRKGFEVFNFDPHFDSHGELLKKNYDFVTCTEVFEHFYTPWKEMPVLTQLLKTGGHLLLMTEFRKDVEHFAKWGYRTDNTHVCFLNLKSMVYICEQWGYTLISSDGRISLLRKNEQLSKGDPHI